MSESQTRVLAKGENFSVARIGTEVSSIAVVMLSAFDLPTRLDVSALQLSSDHQVRSNHDFIFYNQSVSAHGAVRIGDREQQETSDDDEDIVDSVGVSLSKLDDDVHRVLVAASLDEDQHNTFQNASRLAVKLIESDSSCELVRLRCHTGRRRDRHHLR